jgi:predicted TPR repeat methyltransferase
LLAEFAPDPAWTDDAVRRNEVAEEAFRRLKALDAWAESRSESPTTRTYAHEVLVILNGGEVSRG